jgi:hypothetical protein
LFVFSNNSITSCGLALHRAGAAFIPGTVLQAGKVRIFSAPVLNNASSFPSNFAADLDIGDDNLLVESLTHLA